MRIETGKIVRKNTLKLGVVEDPTIVQAFQHRCNMPTIIGDYASTVGRILSIPLHDYKKLRLQQDRVKE